MGAASSLGISTAVTASSATELRATLAGLDAASRAKLASALDTGPELYYFAIASMMNNVSLNARGLFSLESKPAELQDHDIIFYGPLGMAGAVPAPGKSFHGVLHKLTADDMAKLDKIEMSVARRPGKARLYDGALVDCSVYCDDPEKKKATQQAGKDQPPEERYVDIMVEGAAAHAVAEEYIAKLRAMPTRPRPNPADFIAFQPPAEGVPAWSFAEAMSKGDGADGKPHYFVVNGKVVELLDTASPLAKFLVGDITLQSAKMKYDPKYGMPESFEAMSDEHRAYIEDGMARTAQEGGPMHGKLRLVATIAT